MAEMKIMEDYIPALHQTFRIQLEGVEPIDLELIEVKEMGKPYRPEARVPFSLFFLGPVSNQYLLQHIYLLENEMMGPQSIFLVPRGPEPSGQMVYEAVFN